MLAYAGASVALVGTTASKLEEVAQEIQHHGHTALAFPANVAEDSAMASVIQTIQQKWGRLDIVLANAGSNGVWAPIEDLKLEEWEQTLKVNLTGTFLTLKHAAPLLKKAGGSVIVTASVNGTRMFSNTGATAYACSKAAQVTLVKMLALEWAPDKVRVNVICPGTVETNINESTVQRNLEEVSSGAEFPDGHVPLKKETDAGSAGDVAQLVWFLASDAASHITGTEIFIDGAQSLLQG